MLYRLGGYFDHYGREQNHENLQLNTHQTPNNQELKVLSNKAPTAAGLQLQHDSSGGFPQNVNLGPIRTLQERLHLLNTQ